ncbi:hypothetical protein Leryth_007794 [Lithospermum erythrorhizon]|uniref:Uncharacterized protein n=1 Tax=Lithospermum erythrorhizon TaxID=34254 RepID=A0AAV3RPM5_LITER|nr:hypothetical protein Leryth_007794 [Lithospermum erythrorhizon]
MYSTRHQEKFIVKNIEVMDMDHQERKVHNQIQKLRAEDSKLGVDIKEVLINGKYRIVGGDDAQHIASMVFFSRPASPLGGKTPFNPAC